MTDFDCAGPPVATVPKSTPAADSIEVVCFHGDSETLDDLSTGLEAHDRLSVERTREPSAVLDRLQTADGVVADGEAGPELLTRIRERDETVPVVLYTEAPLEPLLDGVLDAGWVDVVRPDSGRGSVEVLANRLCTLVDYRRTATLARRATAAAEAATDGLAVVAVDETIAYATTQFARQFGYEQADLAGRPWRELFADETVARLEADAITAVDDGWQWTGTCEGRLADGGSVSLRTQVTDAPDGEMVLAVFQRSADGLD